MLARLSWPWFESKDALRFWTYGLFLFSTFSIAGSEASIILIYGISLWRWKQGQAPGFLHWLLIPLGVYILATVLSGLLSPYEGISPLRAFHNNWRLLLPFALAVLLNELDQQRLLRWLFWGLLLISVYGVIQYFTGADWLRLPEQRDPTLYYTAPDGSQYFHGKGNFTHHLTFGGYMLLLFPLFACLSLCQELDGRWRWIYGLGSLVLALGAFSSLGRSIWLGILFAGWICLMRLSRLLAGLVLLVGIGGAGWGWTQLSTGGMDQWRHSENALERRLSSALSSSANLDRLLMWESGRQGIQDHWWSGIGFANDRNVMDRYREPLAQTYQHRFMNNASAGVHNIYLQTWLNYGILGILGYLGWVLGTIWASGWALSQVSFQSWQGSILWGSIAGLGGFAIAGNFENNFRDGEVQTALLMLMGLALSQIQKMKAT